MGGVSLAPPFVNDHLKVRIVLTEKRIDQSDKRLSSSLSLSLSLLLVLKTRLQVGKLIAAVPGHADRLALGAVGPH